MGRPASRAISVSECSLPSVKVSKMEVILLVTDRPLSVELPANVVLLVENDQRTSRAITPRASMIGFTPSKHNISRTAPERHPTETIRDTDGRSHSSGGRNTTPGCTTGASPRRSPKDVRVELDWLETFLAVVDRGGFTAASAQVHRSQSRVSAHIAALERELGVQLIDRARRPATLTPAGQIFATHAREILADVGSARSAIGILRALDEESVAVLTTPCIGAALFPKVVGDLLAGHPNARVALSEHGWQEGERRHPAEGFVLAVVPADHELAQARSGAGAIEPARLAAQKLVISGMTMSTVPQILLTLGARGLETVPRTTVDTPQTLVTMVRAGVGIGVANAVGLENTDTTGLVVMDIDDPEMFREVAVYWYDELLSYDVGQSLLRSVIQAQPPPGGSRIGQDGEVLLTGPGISQSNDGNLSAAQRLSQR